MAKIQIKSETRHELSFFPNSFDDYVPKDSKVRMVDRIVRSMDINPLMDTYDGTGAPPYSPMMLLSLVIFAYINGVYSCRGIADVLKIRCSLYVDLWRQATVFRDHQPL